jgi:predicted metal-binding membrane protein
MPLLADRALRRDRLVAGAGLVALALLAWLSLWWQARNMASMPMPMPGMPEMAMDGSPMPGAWVPVQLALTFLMWATMMVAMMLPSALPAMLLYGTMVRKGRAAGTALPPAWIFAAGYLAVWISFSAGAALVQTWLAWAGMISPMLVSSRVWLTGGLLIVAGAYQFLPVKGACLERCRNPLSLFMFHRREGAGGLFAMGVENGLYCLGCCWALMLLLFVAGVMNLLWVAALSALVLIEKLLPGGPLAGRVAGALMLAAGAAVLMWPGLTM